jgi:hypothetical protein
MVPLLAEMLKGSEVRARCRQVAALCAGSQAVGVACDEIEALALVGAATSALGASWRD